MVCHVLFIVLRKKKVKVLFTFRILFVKIHVVLTYLLSQQTQDSIELELVSAL